jgi:hypothetical protein
MKSLIQKALETDRRKGRANDDKRGFIQSIILAVAGTPTTNKKKNPSYKKCFDLLGIPSTSGYRITKTQQQKRADIMAGLDVVEWSKVKSCKSFWTKVPQETRNMILDWIYKHPDAIHSPLHDDTLLVPDPTDATKKVRKNKVLLQVSVRELHNDLYCPTIGLGDADKDKNGDNLISDTMMRALLPPELRMITNHYKMMCCCESCMLAHYYQSALNRFRLHHLS